MSFLHALLPVVGTAKPKVSCTVSKVLVFIKYWWKLRIKHKIDSDFTRVYSGDNVSCSCNTID